MKARLDLYYATHHGTEVFSITAACDKAVHSQFADELTGDSFIFYGWFSVGNFRPPISQELGLDVHKKILLARLIPLLVFRFQYVASFRS